MTKHLTTFVDTSGSDTNVVDNVIFVNVENVCCSVDTKIKIKRQYLSSKRFSQL